MMRGFTMSGLIGKKVEYEKRQEERNLEVYAILVFFISYYSSTFIFGSILVKSFHPFALTFLRLFFINVFLFIVGWRHIKGKRIPLKLLFILAIAGFIGISVSHISLHTGLKHTDPITAALIYALGPLITSFITYFYLKDRRRIYFWIGIILGIIGFAFEIGRAHD